MLAHATRTISGLNGEKCLSARETKRYRYTSQYYDLPIIRRIWRTRNDVRVYVHARENRRVIIYVDARIQIPDQRWNIVREFDPR